MSYYYSQLLPGFLAFNILQKEFSPPGPSAEGGSICNQIHNFVLIELIIPEDEQET